jgi:hypothetical protein
VQLVDGSHGAGLNALRRTLFLDTVMLNTIAQFDDEPRPSPARSPTRRT